MPARILIVDDDPDIQGSNCNGSVKVAVPHSKPSRRRTATLQLLRAVVLKVK